MEFSVNFLPVIISAVLFMPFGAFLYSSKGLGDMWLKAIGKTQEEINDSGSNMPLLMGIAVITSLITVYIIAVLIQSIGIVTVGSLIVLLLILYFIILSIRIKNSVFDGNFSLLKVNMLGTLGEFLIVFLVFAFFI